MLQTSLVSIIIPTFNRGDLIHDTLDSILNQTYAHWECIVVDDGSNDDTDVIMGHYCSTDERFQYYKRPEYKPKGANSCRNYGFEKSKGEFIQWFDSDDILDDKKIELQLDALKREDKFIAICDFQMFKGDQKPFGVMNANLSKNTEILFSQFVGGKSILNTQIILWHRSVISEIIFDETLFRAQDLDFIYRAIKYRNHMIAIQSQVLCSIRVHGDSITSRFHEGNKKAIDSEISVRKMIFEDVYNYAEDDVLKLGVLKTLLSSYKALLIHKYYKDFKEELVLLINKHTFPLKIKLSVLLVFGCLYKYTGRGLFLYGKLTQSI